MAPALNVAPVGAVLDRTARWWSAAAKSAAAGRRIGAWLLAFVVLGCSLAALLKLLPLWYAFDTVPVRLQYSVVASEHASSPPGGTPCAGSCADGGSLFDAVLLQQLPHLRYIRSFDQVFEAGERVYSLRRPIWFDRCEVRQGAFAKFAQWSAFNPRASPAVPGQARDWRPRSTSHGHAISGRLQAPASGVTWFDAYAYCRAAAGRLPSSDEWIAAAAGREGRLYPWGDRFDAAGWSYIDPLLNAARRCAATAETNTPEGIADMGHGVSEWADDGGDPALTTSRVMGGNGFDAPRQLHSLAALYRQAPRRYRSPYLGFRCVYDQPPPAATPWRTSASVVALPFGDYSVGVPKGARIPNLVVNLPSSRFHLIRSFFEREDDSEAAGSDVLHVTRQEITRRQYAAFLRDPFVGADFHAESNQPKGHRHRPPDWDAQMANPDRPVVNVDWWSAYAFASWAGGRLPTAEEWESIASGQGRRLYPWGDEFSAATPLTGERAVGAAMQTTPETGDVTPDGVLALGGGVSEWTRSVSTAAGGYAVVVKGGNFLLPGEKTARMDYRNHVPPHYRAATLGFRVVFDRPR